MLLVIGVSFAPLVGFSIAGLFMVFFPKATLNLQHFSGSMKGNLFNNSLSFRDSAVIGTRMMGIVFIIMGIGIFLLINGWLDWLVFSNT